MMRRAYQYSPLKGDLQRDGDLPALKAELERRVLYDEAIRLVLTSDYAFFRTWKAPLQQPDLTVFPLVLLPLGALGSSLPQS